MHYTVLITLLSCAWPSSAGAQEIWQTVGGTTTVSLDIETLKAMGVTVEGVDETGLRAADSADRAMSFAIDGVASLTFTVGEGGLVRFVGGEIRHAGGFTLRSSSGIYTLYDFAIAPEDGQSIDRLVATESLTAGADPLLLARAKAAVEYGAQRLVIHSPELRISPGWARAVGDPGLAGRGIGTVTVTVDAEWIGGNEPAQLPAGGGGPRGGTPCPPNNPPIGPDVIVGSIPDVSNYASVGGIEALAIGTTSCNLGDAELQWIAGNNQHPVIGQNLFRLKADRFEHIGQAWLKHGFAALQGTVCCSNCQPSGTSSRLGVGCSDPYGSGLNGAQSGLGPKFEVNADTGDFLYPYTGQGQTGNSIYKRVQVHISDVDPAQNGGGQYFAEAQYVTPDDAAADNQNNNASYREVTVSGGGSSWSFSLTGSTQRMQAGIRAWQDVNPAVLETDVQMSGEGLFIVAALSTSLGGGMWHYEYAVQNLNSDRSAGSFSVPIDPGALVQNIGFHDVDYHSGEPFDGTDWTGVFAGGAVTWSTESYAVNPNANALRWGTLDNFRFDANVPPQTTTATLGLFKPGSPLSVSVSTEGPAPGPQDCNNNGIEDGCDIDCGPTGGACDVPGCGGSLDCNGNGIPDECEADCNSNGIPDGCDVDPTDPDGNGAVSPDCNGNGIPDECETFTPTALGTILVASGLTNPLDVTAPPGDVTRVFIVEQPGRIMILKNGTLLVTPFLDIDALVGGPVDPTDERGLLGLAFDPNYASNGFFYVDYTDNAGDTVIARYQVSADPDVADPTSALILRAISQPEANHNGGQLQFGPDGMLYIAMGDGGGANDQHGSNGNGQNTGTLLGKMLRLDVNNPPSFIPIDNPFFGPGLPLDEIWAIGLRNPWRFSFDWATGDMYVADVGQFVREEIDFQPAGSGGGENYGWRCMEGFRCTGLSGCTCNSIALTLPILDYNHTGGACSITGGYVYRGCEMPDLSGTYFYADFCTSWIKSFRYVNGVITDQQDRTAELTPDVGSITSISSFGEDAAGELYICDLFGGEVFKIVPAASIPHCGNGILEPGEECDDGNTVPGDGCDENCQLEFGNNDQCLGAVPICPGTVIGSTSGADSDGSASCGASSSSPDVWYSYTPGTDGVMTVETCGAGDYDTVLSVHSGCPGTSGNEFVCNDDNCANFKSSVSLSVTAGTTYLIRVSGWAGSSGNFGLALTGPDCAVQGDAIRGGKLWDRWWVEIGALPPPGDHPLYPPAGQQSGSITWRCKECHGWDYKGASGAYASGPHFTGIPGVFGSTMTAQQMFDIVKLGPGQVANGHGFGGSGLSDQDISDVVVFMQSLVIDTDTYIDAAAQFLGDEVQGGAHYTTGGSSPCIGCHGADGRVINFGTPVLPEFVGTVAVNNPWELLHKIRVGQPGAVMPSWLAGGGTDQGAADIGRYAQLNLCVGWPEGDMDGDGDTDGADIARFVDAVVSGSSSSADVCPGDFNLSGSVDLADVPDMVNALLSP